MTPIRWRKSTYSNSGTGQCVEVGAFDDTATPMIAVRDSKWDDAPPLMMLTSDWTGLITWAKAGELLS